LLRINSELIAGVRFFRLENLTADVIRDKVLFCQITDETAVKVCDLKLSPAPSFAGADSSDSPIRPKGCLLLPDHPIALYKHAAKDAFRNLTLSRMKELLANLVVRFPPRRVPTCEYEVCRWLVAHALEVDVTDSAILDPILATRKMKMSARFGTAFTPENIDVADGVLDADDFKAARKHVASNRKTDEKAKSGTAGGTAGGGGKHKYPSSPSGARLKAMQDGAEVPLKMARSFMPFVKGCILDKDTTFHYRFKATYPNEPPMQRVKTSVWNEGVSEFAAFQVCVQWAWAQHCTKLPDEVCPFDFELW
jgi:hypothetical protein